MNPSIVGEFAANFATAARFGAIRPRYRIEILGETKVRSALWVLIEGVAVGDATSVTVLVKKASTPSWAVIASVAATASAVAAIALAASVIGFFIRRARPWERAMLLVGALLLIVPEIVTDFIGMAIVGGILAVQFRRPSDLAKREISIS